MHLAQAIDKEAALKILCEAFDKNPRINCILKQDHRRPKRLRQLASYAFTIGQRRGAVFLTADKLGLAIVFPSHRLRLSLYEKCLQFKMAIQCFSPERLIKVLKIEKRFEQQRGMQEPFLYFWFFGVANEALGSADARNLLQSVFSLSDCLELPIYLETSLERNTKIYARYGFELYKRVNVEAEQLSLWYMRKPCGSEEAKDVVADNRNRKVRINHT